MDKHLFIDDVAQTLVRLLLSICRERNADPGDFWNDIDVAFTTYVLVESMEMNANLLNTLAGMVDLVENGATIALLATQIIIVMRMLATSWWVYHVMSSSIQHPLGRKKGNEMRVFFSFQGQKGFMWRFSSVRLHSFVKTTKKIIQKITSDLNEILLKEQIENTEYYFTR